MSEKKEMTRLGRRARLAATIVAAALALPGLAVANHTTCNKQSNEVGPGINCPEFSPDFAGSNVSNRVVDSESTVSFEYAQADHESSTMLIEAYAPRYWQFNTQLRPSATAGACTGSAEAISGNSWRLRSLAGTNRAATERTGAAYFSNYDVGTETIIGCARLSGGVNLPFTVSKLAGSHPFAATHGWKVTISTRAFIESIAGSTGSMVRLAFDLNQRTSGTWHQNQSGQFERAIFSQASHTPLTTDLRAEATTCRRGLDSFSATGCAANDTLKVLVQTGQFNISPAPTVAPLDFGQLTGPARVAGTTAEKSGPDRRNGFGLVMGSNNAVVTFTQPSAHPDETVKGYVLTVALPGQQGSRSNKYVVTKSGEPGFDSSVCGATGTAASCSITLSVGSLPRDDGGQLNPNFDGAAKYDLALVTLFMSGKRSDGLCDDGSNYGTLCAPTTPLWFSKGGAATLNSGISLPGANYGISSWQFLWRTKSYPVFLYTSAFRGNGSGAADDELEPFMVLLADYATKEAEFVIWGSYTTVNTFTTTTKGIGTGRAKEGPGTSFKQTSNLNVGDGVTGVIKISNNASPTGTAARFDFSGETDIFGGNGLVSITEPGDVSLGSSIPPSPTVSRQMSVATRIFDATTDLG